MLGLGFVVGQAVSFLGNYGLLRLECPRLIVSAQFKPNPLLGTYGLVKGASVFSLFYRLFFLILVITC